MSDLKRIRLTGIGSNIRHPDDVQRIVRIFRERGYAISDGEAQALWEEYSDSFAAGWLFLPADDEELFASVSPFFEDA